MKNGAAAKETLSCMAEATILKFVCKVAMSHGFAQRNPKNQAETFNWMTDAIREFGFAQISTGPQNKSLIDYSKNEYVPSFGIIFFRGNHNGCIVSLMASINWKE